MIINLLSSISQIGIYFPWLGGYLLHRRSTGRPVMERAFVFDIARREVLV
jgi:hypothetical protein